MSKNSKRRTKYRVELTPRFDKEFSKLTKEIKARIAEKIDKLKENPHVYKKLHGKLKGLFSMRVGDYRIIFMLDERRRRVILLSVAHRKRVYK